MAEAGVKNMVVTNWYGIVAPAATPRPALERLSREIVAAIRQPEVAKRLAADGSEAVGSTPDEFRALIATERDKWARVIRDRGIKAQ